LTPDDARKLLGNSITGGATSANAATNDIDVSTCAYTQQFPSNTPVSTVREALSVTILVRAAKSDAGAVSNSNQFGPRKPTDAQDINGYGDNAYWYPAGGQLNILKRNNWYILTYGKISPNDRTLEQTKQFADLIIAKL
jgi:hypothetical protein